MAISHRRQAVLASALGLFLVLAGVVGAAAASNRRASLPPVAPDRLLASVLSAVRSRPTISGKVDAWANLGLPDLAAEGYASQGSPLANLTSVHHLRVWESRAGLRLTELLPTNERSVFVSNATRQVWAWDSSSFTAYRLIPPPEGGPDHSGEATAPKTYADPLSLVRLLLTAANPTTVVRVDGAVRVAGRDAYDLVIEPRTSGTLVGRIDVAVDAERRLPLSVSVTPRFGGRPALYAHFTSVDFGPVDPSTYRFAPPGGAHVLTPRPGASPSVQGPLALGAAFAQARTFGTGWATVVAVPAPPLGQVQQAKGLSIASLFPLSSPLFSAQFVQRPGHAWLVFGMVPQRALDSVAAGLS